MFFPIIATYSSPSANCSPHLKQYNTTGVRYLVPNRVPHLGQDSVTVSNVSLDADAQLRHKSAVCSVFFTLSRISWLKPFSLRASSNNSSFPLTR